MHALALNANASAMSLCLPNADTSRLVMYSEPVNRVNQFDLR